MGNEIAKLKNENKRTKTSIQRMKSFQNHQRKVRAAMRDQNGELFLGHDVMLDKRGRLIHNRDSFSKCDSDRRHAGLFAACNYSDSSAGEHHFEGYENQLSIDEQMSDEEFNNKRKSIRNMRGASQGM